MGKVDGDWNEQRSVIADKGDVGHANLAKHPPSEGEGPIIVSAPFALVNDKPRSVFVGERIAAPITIENTTTEAVELHSVYIYDSKPSDTFTLSLMEPPSESSDEDDSISSFKESSTLESRMLRARKTLIIWLSCKPEGMGLHSACVHFDVGDNKIERMCVLMCEDEISPSLACYKLVKGNRPSNRLCRGFVKELPDYPIPSQVRKIIESKGIPDAVLEGLTEKNYIRFFSYLVMMEELQMEEDMRSYDMESVKMKLKGNVFLTLEVPGLAERRPSLVSGDQIFAKLVSEDENNTSSAIEGYIHHIEGEEVYLKFNDDFHSSHDSGNAYAVQFSHNRGKMRRLYQAIEETEQLDMDILFPSRSCRMISKNHNSLHPVSFWLNKEQRNAVEYILACKGGPPYVIHGPPGTGKTITLTESICQLYTRRGSARILVCAPSDSAADNILEKLVTQKTIKFKTGEVFRLNAQTRPLEDIKTEYLDYSLYDEQKSVFQCPILDHLLQYKIIVSTCASAFLLYSEGIERGHFTHIFLDEAGQTSEPETMVPLSHLYRTDTVVVLAGDPKQLGPVIYSKTAESYGLKKSYFERLFECTFYGKGDPNYVTKLYQYYRCHSKFLHLPSQYSDYDEELWYCPDNGSYEGRVTPEEEEKPFQPGYGGNGERGWEPFEPVTQSDFLNPVSVEDTIKNYFEGWD